MVAGPCPAGAGALTAEAPASRGEETGRNVDVRGPMSAPRTDSSSSASPKAVIEARFTETRNTAWGHRIRTRHQEHRAQRRTAAVRSTNRERETVIKIESSPATRHRRRRLRGREGGERGLVHEGSRCANVNSAAMHNKTTNYKNILTKILTISQLNVLIDRAASVAGSEYKLAKQLAMQQPTISAWKSGKRRCSPADRAALAAVAGEDAAAEAITGLLETLEGDESTKATAARVALQRALAKMTRKKNPPSYVHRSSRYCPMRGGRRSTGRHSRSSRLRFSELKLIPHISASTPHV